MAEYLFHLTPLTPIHIGSGEQLEPFEYVMTAERMYRFTLDDFMLKLPREQQEAFVDMVGQSIPATRNFVSDHLKTAAEVARWQADISGAAETLYRTRLSRGEGHPEVRACSRTNERPYLPGSSLKGAIRTALLYYTMAKPQQGRDARYLEQNSFEFKWVQEDPFRAFKLGDGQTLNGSNKVRAVAINTLRHGQWDKDVALLVETIPGQLSDAAEAISTHAVNFDDNFYRLHPAAYRITAAQVISACRDFYGTHLAREQAYTTALPQTSAAYQALVDYARSLPNHACLLRLGWGSGQGATTVSYGLADEKSPTSRRLTDDGFPLGWVELSITTPDGKPLEVKDIVPAIADLSATVTSPVQKETPPEPPPEPLKYPIHSEVEAKIVGDWSKGTVKVELPAGEQGYLKISRKQLKKLNQETVTLVVTKVKKDIYYLEQP